MLQIIREEILPPIRKIIYNDTEGVLTISKHSNVLNNYCISMDVDDDDKIVRSEFQLSCGDLRELAKSILEMLDGKSKEATL